MKDIEDVKDNVFRLLDTIYEAIKEEGRREVKEECEVRLQEAILKLEMEKLKLQGRIESLEKRLKKIQEPDIPEDDHFFDDDFLADKEEVK